MKLKMTNQIGSGSAQGLIEYLDQLAEKGRVSTGSIKAFTSTVKQVLATVDGNDLWNKTDVRSLDINDYISRFKTLSIGKYSPDSYTTYFSRLNKVKEWYLKFLSDPGWVPTVKVVKSNSRISKSKVKLDPNNQLIEDKTNIEIETIERKNNEDKKNIELTSYPFPLRPGKTVTLYLPTDLTQSEARRLCRFIDSLSIEDETIGN